MTDYDLILICQSNIVDYDAYSSLPIDRLDVYRTLAYPRMVRSGDRFISHLDTINQARGLPLYGDADFAARRRMLNIWNLPSASGLHLANLLIEQGFSVKLVNNLDSEWDLFEQAYRDCRQPPLVGISSTFYLSFKEVGRVTRRLRRLDPDMEIVLGGAFANSSIVNGSAAKLEAPMRRHGIRYALHAFNSEPDLIALLRMRRDGRAIDGVNNLAYLGEGARGPFNATRSQWNEPVLDETPANWDRIDAPFLNRTVQIRTASSCPFSCDFCSYPTTAGKWKTITPERVRLHLESIKRIPGIDRVIFIDDTFNVPPHRFKELLTLFKEYDFEWFSFLRVQYVDDDIVRSMKESGCAGVYLGIESANDRVLKHMNKKVTRADFERGLALLNKYDIPSLSAFVLGFPGEDDESIRDNVDFINNAGVTFYSLKEFYYMEHTGVHDKRDQYGLTGSGAQWSHNTMSYQQASQIKLDMFSSIDGATFVDPDTSLWYMAYLYDQGFTFADIDAVQGHLNAIMRAQLTGDMSPDSPGFAGLRRFLAGRDQATP